MNKKIIIFSLLVLGISSIIGQSIVIRELLGFYGNEFFIGWILASWLLWTAMGSFLAGKVFKNDIISILYKIHLSLIIILPLEIFILRLSYRLIIKNPGEIPNLISALFSASLFIAPLCIILGMLFVAAGKSWKSFSKDKTGVLLSKSYLYENLGFILGGLVFSFALVFLNEFKTIGILMILNFGVVFLILKNRSALLKVLITLIFAGISVVIITEAGTLNFATSQMRFSNQKLVESQNSIYGNIAVTKMDSQYNFYENGLLLGTNKENAFNEYLIHFPLLYHQNPQKILLIGNGLNGAIREILKHNPEKIYYIELDSKLVEITQKYLPDNLIESMQDKRVKIINSDGRYFLKNTKEKFDAIILNIPDPSTAFINRLYTKEFFDQIKSRLNPKGIFSFYLSSSPNYMNKELINLQASIYQTLKKISPSIVLLSEDLNFFIAAKDEKINYNPTELISRMTKRKIKNNFVTKDYIKYRLLNQRNYVTKKLLDESNVIGLNTDLKPVGYYYNFVYWLSYFYSNLSKQLNLSQLKGAWLLLFFVFALIIFLLKIKFKGKNKLPFIMAIIGFSIIASEIIVIYLFQIFFGYIYHKISLIITLLMVGLTLGTFLGIKLKSNHKNIIKINLFIIIVLSLILIRPSALSNYILIFLFSILIGGLGGLGFSIISRVYYSEYRNKNMGAIYGADLLGSCIGAFITSIFTIPMFGIANTLIILIALNSLPILIHYFKL